MRTGKLSLECQSQKGISRWFPPGQSKQNLCWWANCLSCRWTTFIEPPWDAAVDDGVCKNLTLLGFCVLHRPHQRTMGFRSKCDIKYSTLYIKLLELHTQRRPSLWDHGLWFNRRRIHLKIVYLDCFNEATIKSICLFNNDSERYPKNVITWEIDEDAAGPQRSGQYIRRIAANLEVQVLLFVLYSTITKTSFVSIWSVRVEINVEGHCGTAFESAMWRIYASIKMMNFVASLVMWLALEGIMCRVWADIRCHSPRSHYLP